ncbi:MAG: hypothetical protein J6D27_00315 [Ruminiclostridium sp.]|nr:hypothetical protein [Ruminiclostridium sp.]
MEKPKAMFMPEADIITKIDELFTSALECAEHIERSKGEMYVVGIDKPYRIETAIINAHYNMAQYHVYLEILEKLDFDEFRRRVEANSQQTDRILKAIEHIYSLQGQSVQPPLNEEEDIEM